MSNNKQSSVEKEFVPYEESLALKELGFDEPCFAIYVDKQLHINATYQNHLEFKGWVATPTFSQAFRWFREKYKLKYCIIPLVCEQGYSDLYESRIHQEKHSISRIGNYKIYEEAELACLRKLIEIVIEKQDNEQQ